MTNPLSNLNSAVLVSKAALDAAVSSLPDIAQDASNALATADAAIPKSLIGTAPGDVVALDVQGRLPAVDGSQLTGLTTHPSLPALIFELGNNAQPNGGLGIDNGSYYQVDCRINPMIVNFPYTANNDGTINVPDGLYLIAGSAKIILPSQDTVTRPAQMVFAFGQGYSWPGVYQSAVQTYPLVDAVMGSDDAPGVLGSVIVNGVIPLSKNSPVWMGFSKVLGSQRQIPLALQGHVSIVKIG